jgi:hypothetical protein
MLALVKRKHERAGDINGRTGYTRPAGQSNAGRDRPVAICDECAFYAHYEPTNAALFAQV